MSWTRNHSRILALGALIALALSGCAGAPATPEAPGAPPRASAEPVPVPEPVPSRLVPGVEPGTVVATGTIRPHNEAVNGRVTGELSIVAAEDSTFVLRIDEVSSPEYPTLAWALVDVPYDEVTCWEGFWSFDGGNLPMTAGSGGHISHVDPSAYREVLLTGTRPGEELVLGCTYPVIAIAQLSWTMPNPFAGLAPRDGGVRTGATGEVSVRDDGTLATYTVAWGDSRGAIRDRFGLDLEEFWYLNPRNPPFLEPSTTMEQFAAADAEVPLNAGDIVNLDPADRSR